MTSPATTGTPRTIVDKIWADHVVTQDQGAPAVLAVDLHLVHEVTSPQAFTGLRERGLRVRRPSQTVATADHSIPTTPRSLPMLDMQAAAQISQLERNCEEFGIPLHGIGSPSQGIVHVIGPQLGLTQPGMTIVCGDSHTSTHGAFGALAFGIGTSEVEMVLATQTLLQRDPKTYEVRVDGRLAPGVSSKDIILALIARIGVGGGTGHVFEYRGEAIRALTHGTAHDHLQHEHRGRCARRADRPGRHDVRVRPRPAARPTGRSVGRGGRPLADPADRRGSDLRQIDHHRRRHPRADDHLRHQPGHGHPDHLARAVAGGRVRPVGPTRPGARAGVHGPAPRASRSSARRSMSSSSGRAPTAASATCAWLPPHSRTDKVADGVALMVTPGSDEVKREAEREGLADIFKAAGADWRESGCSMCIAMNGDQLSPGQYAVSTVEPELRRSPGQGRPDVPGVAADRRGDRHRRGRHRPADPARDRVAGRGRGR